MEKQLKELYKQEIDQFRLDFDGDPEYQAYYTQAEALWEGGEMPKSFYHLLEAGNFLSFLPDFNFCIIMFTLGTASVWKIISLIPSFLLMSGRTE